MWKVFETQDGSSSVFSEKFGVSYHSKYGALQESLHVFIQSGLFYKSITNKSLSILEMGFGTGLNAFLTAIETDRHDLTVRYTAIENFPLPDSVISQLNFPAGPGRDDDLFDRLHKAAWSGTTRISPSFSIKKLKTSFTDVDFVNEFDLIYFDAFAPGIQPELWEQPMMEQMFTALKSGGILVTYCAKGAFKRVLRKVGFQVEAIKGPPGKREMTRAKKPS